jgi:hypothetical protein
MYWGVSNDCRYIAHTESPDPDGNDKNEIKNIPLILPHLRPPLRSSTRGRGLAANNVTIQHEIQKIALAIQRYIVDIAIKQGIRLLTESRIQPTVGHITITWTDARIA